MSLSDRDLLKVNTSAGSLVAVSTRDASKSTASQTPIVPGLNAQAISRNSTQPDSICTTGYQTTWASVPTCRASSPQLASPGAGSSSVGSQLQVSSPNAKSPQRSA